MFKDPKTHWQGIQLDYDRLIENVSDTREDLYCLTWSEAKTLIAVIDAFRYQTRWFFAGEIDRALINNYVNDIQRRLMMPCGDDNTILLSQFTPSGVYQESTDGGETYHDVPGKDPRNAIPIPPPFLPIGTEEAECTYADSIVNMLINEWINATGDGEDLANVIAGILTFLEVVLAQVGAIVAIIVLAIASGVVEGTVAAWKAAFTTDVWNRLRCNLHDNQHTDGSFTSADVDAIYARLGEEETGIVLISLQQMIAAVGWQGLTIAARAGRGSPTADCACSDDFLVYSWDEIAGAPTLVTADEDGLYTAHSGTSLSAGRYVCSIFYQNELPVPATWDCLSLTVVSDPTGNTVTKYKCSDYTPGEIGPCAAQWTFYSTTSPFDITFNLDDC